MWAAGDLDEILFLGDRLYRDIVGTPYQSRYLEVVELPKLIDIQGCMIHLTLHPIIVGLINPMNNENEIVTLEEALNGAFSQAPSCFLTVKDYTICCLQDSTIGGFFVFDSHSRDMRGLCASDGNAVLVHVQSVNDLVLYFNRLFESLSVRENEQFDIVPAYVFNEEPCGRLNREHGPSFSNNDEALDISQPPEQGNTYVDASPDSPALPTNPETVQLTVPIVIAVPHAYSLFNAETQKQMGIGTPILVKSKGTPERRRGHRELRTPLKLRLPLIPTPERVLRREKERSRKRASYANLTPRRKEIVKKRVTDRKCRRKLLASKDSGYLASKVIAKFHKEIRESPSYVCTCCHRLLYKKGVVCLTQRKLNKVPELQKTSVTGFLSEKGKEWICHTCDRTVAQGRTPAQAVGNKMEVCDVPEEIANLSTLEARLLATRYPFMKILALPRGKQSGIKGAIVNVPVNAAQVCESLPRTPNAAGIVPLQLKRRIHYRSSVLKQNIRPDAVKMGLSVLCQINKFYNDIQEDTQWEENCIEEDHTLWKELTTLNMPEGKENDEPSSENAEAAGMEKDHNDHSTENDKRTGVATERSDSPCTAEVDEAEEVSQIRGVVYDTCLQEADPAVLDDGSFSIAPGEGRCPVPIMADENCEERAFPQLFPTGEFGFSIDRPVKLSVKKYFNARLLSKDGRFAKNIEYLFFAQYITEQKQVYDSLSIALRKTRSGPGSPITAAFLKDPERMRNIIFKDEAYRFLQPVRGTPPYWQKIMYDLLAAIKQLGIFTWFLTLSAADLRWNDTIQSIARQYCQVLTDEQVNKMSWDVKCKWLRENPVTAARHFEFRLDKLFKDVIMNKELQPLGAINDYFFRIEFQQRGSPHAHCVLWVDGAPQLATHSANDVVEFIDKFATCHLPSDDDEMHELVLLQKHSHSKSCQKRGDKCRFRFPKPPATSTVITNIDATDTAMSREMACDIVAMVHKLLLESGNEHLYLEQLLKKANIPQKSYHNALKCAQKSTTVLLKRNPNEININPYNKVILQAWQANTDLQFVIDPYACIHYIVSYVTKDEREMGQVLRAAAAELGNENVKEKMKTCAKQFLQMREVSAQEAVYRVLGLPLHKATFSTVFVSTDFKENRVKIVKPNYVINDMDDDEEDVFAKNVSDRCASRPSHLEQMCLAEFARWYVVVGRQSGQSDDSNLKQNGNESDSLDDELTGQLTDWPKSIRLQDGMGSMRKRSKPSVIRYHSFSHVKEPKKHYHSLLMLYKPWRNEEKDLLQGYNSYAESFNATEEEINTKRKSFESHRDVIDAAVETYEENGPPVHSWDMLAPQTEQERGDLHEEGSYEDPEHLLTQPPEGSAAHPSVTASATDIVISSEKKQGILSDEEFRVKVQSLNASQRCIFQWILKWCNACVKSKANRTKPDPFHIFLTGGAGTGKSHVISAVYQLLMKRLPRHGDDPDDIPVLLTAPTGVAAFNINGITLHSAFLLPLGQTNCYKKLSDDKRNSLRNRFSNLQVLIIDEISMVGSDMLLAIHRRLREIKGLEKAFGGVSIFAIGDLYQLPPVCQPQVFDLPTGAMEMFQGSLWEDHFKVVQLSEIMRQKEDAAFAQLLSRIRTGDHTSSDVELLSSRVVTPHTENHPQDALHVYATNAQVKEHNEEMLNLLDAEIKEIPSIDVIPAAFGEYKLSDDDRYTGGLAKILRMGTGARVMLIRNVDVGDGLVNGSQGNVVGFEEKNQKVKKIFVKFDSNRCGIAARRKQTCRSDAVEVEQIEVKFTISKKGGEEIKRCQFPLRLAWAVTIHKVQGITTEKIVVSFQNRFHSGQAYVAMSRVTSFHGLHLLNF